MKRRAPWYFWVGLLSFLASHILILAKIEPVSTYFFVFIWWSYIILVDGLILWIRESSLFSQLKFKTLILIACSYLFWEFFEILNLKINNWSYVYTSAGVISDSETAFSNFIWQFFFRFLAFGSVLPAVLETYNLLEIIGLGRRLEFLGWERSAKLLQWKWWGRPRYLWMTIGLVMIAISLIWPKYFFWLIWIAVILILDPDVEKNGGKGILAELREGKVRTFYRLLLTGLVCGILWEGWNYWAGLKWEYNVPWVGQWKIFEMPVLGYLGFMVFAVECYVFYQWLGCKMTLKERF